MAAPVTAMAEVIAPDAINTLKEALTHIYWYKRDLRAFLVDALDGSSILSEEVDWETSKRAIASMVVETLIRDQYGNHAILLNLMTEVSRMEDFSHLARLHDGAGIAKRATEAVAALRKLVKPYDDLVVKAREWKLDQVRKARVVEVQKQWDLAQAARVVQAAREARAAREGAGSRGAQKQVVAALVALTFLSIAVVGLLVYMFWDLVVSIFVGILLLAVFLKSFDFAFGPRGRRR